VDAPWVQRDHRSAEVLYEGNEILQGAFDGSLHRLEGGGRIEIGEGCVGSDVHLVTRQGIPELLPVDPARVSVRYLPPEFHVLQSGVSDRAHRRVDILMEK
jgi:hypothetical protein